MGKCCQKSTAALCQMNADHDMMFKVFLQGSIEISLSFQDLAWLTKKCKSSNGSGFRPHHDPCADLGALV